VRLAAGFLDRIGVRATAETVSEMIAEVASRLPDEEMDRLVQLVVHLLDTERNYIREVLAS
jgi:predicted DNA-binding protein